MTTLEPGWLMKTCHKAHILSMCNHSPSFFAAFSPAETPVSDSDAAELYALMAARFEAWTGKPLGAYQQSTLNAEE